MRARLVMLGAAVLAAPLTAAAPDPAGRAYTALYLGRGGPAHLQLHVQVNGRPADAVWIDAVQALFTFCDRDGDGQLDPVEQAVFTSPRSGREPEVVAAEQQVLAPLRLSFPGRGTRVTVTEFAGALREAGYAPVSLSLVPARSDSGALTAALLRTLDQDGDGRLSARELRAARDQAASLDVNEDELLSAAEVLGRPVSPTTVAPLASVAAQPAQAPDLELLSGDAAVIARQLVTAWGGSRATGIRRTDFPGDERVFGVLDTNSDKRVEAGELEQWLRQPPTAELAITITADGSANAALRSGPADAARGPSEEILLSLARLRFRVEPPGMSDTKLRTVWDRRARQVQARLAKLGAGKGVVPREQLKAQPDLLALGDFADRNRDEQLDAAEVASALGLLGRLVACRAAVTAQDEGSLFESLDRNSDSRLSPRELVDAIASLQPFTDAAGQVAPEELPRHLVVRVAPASIPVVLAPLADAPTPARASAAPAQAPAPAWFAPMDRNGDGDVSLREFLGPLTLFHSLDLDGDGLISPTEAGSPRPR